MTVMLRSLVNFFSPLKLMSTYNIFFLINKTISALINNNNVLIFLCDVLILSGNKAIE